ncbi:tRNA uracil 4-sulfurtransferase ThiI [Idiomarina loihiensis]|uniref:tRNA uracil 4-sulfurtransferase ThiI n=1 Tax=Idiomarina TaxID=135575 RepID=UPI000C397FB7|nr:MULTISPECIES: tRNA uracil 4-sulfurtransferase ThiI [unclassified Idiomarina]MAA61337.1 tRNA 4-thiouridine(8) synthase ThiI [Idiomarina sp.]|tara:strand:+ start:32348 stop:33799 length:1452 start_codon:yes stop_codon:yes gene_type:complete
MKFVVRLHAEITIKSRSVRKRYGKVLTNNLRKILAPVDDSVYVKWLWDRIEVSADGDDSQVRSEIKEILQNTPGISWFAEVIERPLTDFDAIAELVGEHWLKRLPGKSFAMRVKRKGNHEFNSQQLERYVGGYLLERVSDTSVNLSNPDLDIALQITNQIVHLVGERINGLGGFPIPTQETVLSLLSGGFDSGVATYEFIRRGARTHFCFFNLGGDAHEVAVRQIAYYLWKRYSSSHPIKFISVDFAPIVDDILTNVDNGQMGVVLKRQMLRAADKVARYVKAQALVTGEAMGQVSSQTLSNLKVIDQATSALVLRPLITKDKQEIVDEAKRIGTEPLAKSIPEYCGVISNKPTVKAIPAVIEAEEAKLNKDLLEQVVQASNVLSMQDIATQTDAELALPDTTTELSSHTTIIDIRNDEEIEAAPLSVEVEVIEIPFFKLVSQFAELDQSREYLLYCDQGIMSRMQALLLHENGYNNVSVYKP